jgi:hypothetical protein
MRWLALTGYYVWRVAAREALRSSRWAADDRVRVGVMLGVLASVPVVASAVLWLLTGRGPFRWLGGSYAVVDPFPRKLPPDVAAAIGQRSA